MSRKWLLFLFCLALLILLSPRSRASLTVRVNEPACRIFLQHNNLDVAIVVENSLPAATGQHLRVELLDPRDRVTAHAERDESIQRGSQTLHFLLPFDSSKLNETERRAFLWYRLHYQLTAPGGAVTADGILSLSETTPDLFDLRVAAAELVHEAMRYRARVQAVHPVTKKPAEGVRLDAVLTLETDDSGNGVKIAAAGVTDAKGYATLFFDIPQRFPEFPHESQPAGGSLKVTGQRNGVTAEVEHDVLVDQFARMLLTTDKPLYQPGQGLHMRTMVFSPTKHALANQDVMFRIEDPENMTVFRETVKSSRFGIATVDWPIPENARLGDYWIKAALGTGDDGDDSDIRVRISRYDLPNFSVKVKPDRPYYLDGQGAQIKVSAAYLFGQPVTHGHIRVVRETNREWNYKEQKWDIEEGDKYEGDADANGEFVAQVKLADEHDELRDNEYGRYKDVNYAAYFTDATTNRTEQRRFDLRVTKNAIHVYVIRTDHLYHQNPKLPLEFYVSAFYADGVPAQCRLNINVKSSERSAAQLPSRRLLSLSTNRYGLAKVSGLRLPAAMRADDFQLQVRARDGRGRVGETHEDVDVDADNDQVSIETDKSLYSPGEAITASITSSVPNQQVVFDVVRDAVILSSQMVRLSNGRATVTVPYRSEFKDRVAFVAYGDFAESRSMIGSRTVLFPHRHELTIDATAPPKQSYRPGDEAEFNFRVRTPEGRVAGALGLTVVDKAIDERSRTEGEFGRSYGFSRSFDFFETNDQIAGVSLRDLQNLDLSKPLPPGLDLAAEILLNQNSIYLPYFFGGDSFDDKASSFLADLARTKLSAARDALDAHYVKTRQYPLNDEELARLLSEAGIDLKELRDPWGVPYRAQFSTDKQSDILSFRSAGPDKRFDSDDDFLIEGGRWLYFRNTGEAIDRAVRSFHLRTGKFIRDLATLRTEARTEGLNLDALRDKWNEPYRIAFDIDKDDYVIRISSSGPDKKFPPAPTYDSDDFVVWTSPIDYFADSRAGISEALSKEMQSKQTFPRNEREFSAALRSSNQSFENLRDPWGHAYYAIFNVSSFYADRVQIERRGQFTQSPVQRTEVTPVTTRAAVIDVRSAGPDGKTGTVDDFTAATFSGALADQSGGSDRPAVVTSPVIFTGSDGAVTGLLRDPNGAAIAGATVTATRSNDSQKYSSTTNDEGKYLFSSLPPGLYEFRFTAVGFKATTITNVVVQSQNIVEVNVDMDVGATSETVMVTAAAPAMQTSQSDVANSITISGVINTRQVQSLEMSKRVNVVTKSGSSQDTSTPRLREYFPETLVWQPSLETDNQGRAQFKFKLADNITTWKMSVIGSTEDGEVGMVEKEITAFQPFFVDHDPPRILTAGDQISLPVVVRNYLNRAQNVNLDLKPESWFTLLGPAAQHLNVPAGDATRGTFDFRAVTPVKDGKQRITAIAGDANDAIEKPVTVHPDGEEKSVTGSDIAADRGAVNLDLPAAVIPNTTHAEVKIYPNLMAHVAESVEAIMERPYGCGEQTISSTYPSLLLLTHLKRTGQDSPVRARAERYLRAGYSRLLNYHDESGGFTYWGHGDPDVALTAYALRFLSDASQLMAIDDDLIKKTRGWLIKQQRPDGSWAAYDYWDKHENKRRTALLTAYVAHVLATTADKSQPAKPETQIAPELKQAFAYLAAPAAEIDEPYLIASYALARIETNDAAGAQKLIARLKTLAHEENGASYWSLETNTPFYGWGQAGQIETTALVVQALNKYCGMQNSDCSAQRESGSPANQQLINRGLLFLLRQQDRYGVWYSTQATINVLDAMLSLFARATTPTPSSARLAALSVNGREVKSIEMPEPQRLVTPITVDVSEYLHSGANQIELKRAPGSSPASMQAVVTYYLPWKDSAATPETNWRSNGSSGLRLVTHFDKTESQVQAEINCHVEAERIGLRGYGMMLAEIGLPPGADVDRASLETAMKGSDWGISQYDILPDRVVVYLWPQAGGTKFDFKFRPRFGLNAQSAASVVYDYYNPEARAIVAPTRFVVK